MENRTLKIDPDNAGFVFHYEVCAKRIIICTKREMRKETYDLTKPEVRKQLIDMGFVAKVREKI